MLKETISQKMGKLKIYIAPADKIRQGDRTMFRKFFPKSEGYQYFRV